MMGSVLCPVSGHPADAGPVRLQECRDIPDGHHGETRVFFFKLDFDFVVRLGKFYRETPVEFSFETFEHPVVLENFNHLLLTLIHFPPPATFALLRSRAFIASLFSLSTK